MWRSGLLHSVRPHLTPFHTIFLLLPSKLFLFATWVFRTLNRWIISGNQRGTSLFICLLFTALLKCPTLNLESEQELTLISHPYLSRKHTQICFSPVIFCIRLWLIVFLSAFQLSMLEYFHLYPLFFLHVFFPSLLHFPVLSDELLILILMGNKRLSIVFKDHHMDLRG